MKSRANLKSHPVHPILIPFPIAFFTATLVIDAIILFSEINTLALTAKYLNLAGIIGAIAAAIPGIIDYTYTVPPESSAKKRATKHGILNSIMLLLFITAYFLRDNVSLFFLLALEFPACILMFIAGWMGGTLVHRNLIGVDMRYAHAGKWKEQHFNQNSGSIAVANTDELKTNQMKLLHINGKRIALARTEISYVAFDDRCSHRGGSLASGTMICSTVQCPWHGSQFDVEDGEVKAGPAKERIDVYKVFEKDGKIYLKFD